MPRIDTTNTRERWQWGCSECGSTNWRANNGTFRCRNCHSTTSSLVNKKTDKQYQRDEIEFVGPEASWKAPYKVGD